jgi:triacylglycerol esterase/lipase EstA (alpha/beta hydrolase family)
LSANGLSWVNFRQAQSQGVLQIAVDELKTILSGLEQVVYAAFATVGESGPPLVLLCHSRGGLVTRLALKQLGSAGIPHLSKVITLHTPHHGSYMPKLCNDYNNLVNGKIKFNNVISSDLPEPIRTLVNDLIGHRIVDLENMMATFLKGTFGTEPSGVGFDELIPNSQTLQDLTQDEQPWPGVQYYSFGGSQPKFVAVYVGIAGQVLHLLDVMGGFLLDRLLEQPEIQQLYGGLAELEKGDSAVSLVSSHWPANFQATHQDFPINHMQALIHQPLQNEVLQIIKS